MFQVAGLVAVAPFIGAAVVATIFAGLWVLAVRRLVTVKSRLMELHAIISDPRYGSQEKRFNLAKAYVKALAAWAR